ncbi:DnaJ- protein scj1 [Malassezia cuniculi]|uniref:DnaJ- protein scj1 n=1 Tax=Malassezia cuniculi TaxID=948313 RepID=A0AAF0ET72_9BASI|nr:DnaJ- protein scj1 [Malassezia cuniculi]
MHTTATRVSALLLVCLLLLAPLVAAARDYYEVLGVKRTATEKEIKSVYRKKARNMHPDRNPDRADEFMELTDAYQTLIDPELRRIYDTRGADAVKEHQTRKNNGHVNDPFDIFKQFFGGGAKDDSTPKGPAKSFTAELSVADMYNGRVFTVTHERTVVCPSCSGSGAKSSAHIHRCSACDGQGVQVVRHQIMPGFVTNVQAQCQTCGGAGQVITQSCSRCGGSKTIMEHAEIDVDVEAGAAEGAQYVFEGAGDASPGIDPGDVVVHIHSTPQPGDMRRVGHDLYYTVPLSLNEALFGFDKSFTHYDGHAFDFKRDGPTQYGHVERIQGQGMPIPMEEQEGDKTHGDMFIDFTVVIPKLSAKQRKVIESVLVETLHTDL